MQYALEAKNRRLKHRYNLSLKQWYDLLRDQNYLCAVCETPIVADTIGKGLPIGCVDHCHDTGIVRGILCQSCNSGIGKLGDDPKLLYKAIVYLNKNALALLSYDLRQLGEDDLNRKDYCK